MSGTRLPPMAIVASSVATAAGLGRARLAQALREQRCMLVPNDVSSQALDTVVGKVAAADTHRLSTAWADVDCRNHRLAHLGLLADGFDAAVARVMRRFGAARVGVVMGTSTSSIGASEQAYRARDAQGRVPPGTNGPALHSLHALGSFVERALGLQGPSMTVSTACSSSAKAFAVAQRWLALGIVDAVVVGGVDSLCDSVLFGFHALQLVSREPCRPFDARRQGISLGEAAGFVLLQREADAMAWREPVLLRLLGVGESSDAHHLSAPQPDGASIEAAVRQALAQAGLEASDIDYVNLHGTATLKNDAVEAAMLERVYPGTVHASSTKGCTGHTLGASGVVEAIVCQLAIEHRFKPGTIGSQVRDAVCGPQVRFEIVEDAPVRHAVSHAFGFGGTNAVLVLGAAP